MGSQYYYWKNKEKLEIEKEMKRKLRQKLEQQEQQRKEQMKPILVEQRELSNYYAQDYVLEHSFYLVTSFASFFMIQVKNGERKFE